jgi:hypothetical protein
MSQSHVDSWEVCALYRATGLGKSGQIVSHFSPQTPPSTAPPSTGKAGGTQIQQARPAVARALE